MMQPTSLDFETKSIESRPAYPPEPIGVSIKKWGEDGHYYAWGHKTGNNCTKAQAVKAYKEAVKHGPCLFHNGKFDTDVAEVHFGIKVPAWDQIHDTTFLLFLHDPNLRNIRLKSAAEEILGWPADEKEVMADYLCTHQPVPGVKLSRGPKSEFYYMKYLEHCPGDVVGPYALGDTARTEALYAKLHPRIIERGMSDAYDRERRLMPVLLEMERRGVRVDLPRLRKDVIAYRAVQEKVDAWLRKKLNVGMFFNLDSDQFVEALIAAGLADAAAMGVTKTGKIKTDKTAIANGVTDKQVAAVLQYRAQLHTCMATFQEPWRLMAEASGGYIYNTWNQVRGEGKGARTGRLSSSPNFQNLPKSFKILFWHEAKALGATTLDEVARKKKLLASLPKSPWSDLPPLPKIRSYVVPYQDDHVLIDRDYSQNEIRILAHFGEGPEREDGTLDDGELLKRYKANVWLDMHDTVKDDLLRLAGLDVTRDTVKTINFGLLYGMGVGELARRLEKTVEEAKTLKKAVLSLYPEIEELYKTMKALARADQPLVTWGGREVYCEPPFKDKDTGKVIEWDYRLVNYLIQGSAGDGLKEALIRYHEAAPKGHFMLINVHDQCTASVPRKELVLGHRVMREQMESLEFDVVMKSEGKWGTNWADLRVYDKAGTVVATDLPEQSTT